MKPLRPPRLVAVALALALVGCTSSPSPIEAPASLSDFTPTLDLDAVWHARMDMAAGAQYLRMAPGQSGDYVYVASDRGEVRAYTAARGERVWSSELNVALGTGPVVGGDLLLLGGDAEVVALDRASGNVRWRSAVSSEVLAEPVRDGNVVVVRTVDGALYGFSAADGKRLWRNHDEQVPLLSLRGEGAPVVAGGVVFAGFANGRVAAFGVRDGRLLWESPIAVPSGRTELERLADVDGRLVVTPDAVYAVGFQGRIASLSPVNGRVNWSRELSSYQGVAAVNGTLVVTDADGSVWCMALNNGGTLWRQTALRGRSLNTPVIQGRTLVVADYDGYLHWLSLEDGHFLARTQVKDPLEAFPISSAYDDLQRDARFVRDVLASPVIIGDVVVAMDRRGAISAFRVTEKAKKS